MLQNNPELRNKIHHLWDKLWSGGISNPLTAVEQITYLLFMKRLDDLDLERKAHAKVDGEPYTSRFEGSWLPPEDRSLPVAEQRPIEKRTLRWSEFKHLTPDEMLPHVQTRLFPFLKELGGAESNFTHHMKNAVFAIAKPSLLAEAVGIVDDIFDIMARDARDNGQAFQDIQGDVYEMLLSEIATAGKNGQFRTPRHIIKLMADLVRPELGDRIVDPACGSGGFLLGAYQYIVTQLATGARDLPRDEDGFVRTSAAAALTDEARSILSDSLWGYDIDATLVRLGLMNLIMHGINDPHIDYQDTLSKSYTEQSKYDVVMANPPFTGSIDKGDINENLQLSTTKTELLFVENIYRLLKKGGRACVIVPQGVLFGSGTAFKTLRQILVDRCKLTAVITMPSGVFKPYAGVGTAILLFTKVWGPKDEVLEPATDHVFFYEMEADGYSLDDKRSKQEGYGDLQDIIVKYHDRNVTALSDRRSRCFRVPRLEIQAQGYDLSVSRYKLNVIEDVEFDPPNVILDRLIDSEVGATDLQRLGSIQGGIVGELLELKRLLG